MSNCPCCVSRLRILGERGVRATTRRFLASAPPPRPPLPPNDTAFEISSASLRFGRGVTREIGQDVRSYRHVAVFVDPYLYATHNLVVVEPTSDSFRDAAKWLATEAADADCLIAVGGGSTMDTAKAASLYATYPTDDFYRYVNAPVGKGEPVPGPLRPLVAVPTTAGTASESTGVAIFDDLQLGAKTGIGSRHLRPMLGIVDVDNTRSMTPAIAAATAFDVLSHAMESYTARNFADRPRPSSPQTRPSYQGSNPISDRFALEAVRLCARYMRRAVAAAGADYDTNEDDVEAREQMLLASSLAGIAFGNAGCTLPHGLSYAASSLVKRRRSFAPRGYVDVDGSPLHLFPHGFSVITMAPACFRATSIASPSRHALLGRILLQQELNLELFKEEDAGHVLSDSILDLMNALDAPMNLSQVGLVDEDVEAMAEATLPQRRVTSLAPIEANLELFKQLYQSSL